MGTMLREYETMFIMNPELGDDAVKDVIGRLKGVLEKKEAELLREEALGKKKLAFYVKKQPRGNFHMFHYLGQPGTVEELERNMKNLDQVMRFITIGNGDVKDVAAKKAEVEKMMRDAEAKKAKAEAERKEREAAQAQEQAEAQTESNDEPAAAAE